MFQERYDYGKAGLDGMITLKCIVLVTNEMHNYY